MNKKELKPGQLVQWIDGKIGILVKRFDFYVEKGIASRNYHPRWHWNIQWCGDPPLDYISVYGVPERSMQKFLKVLG